MPHKTPPWFERRALERRLLPVASSGHGLHVYGGRNTSSATSTRTAVKPDTKPPSGPSIVAEAPRPLRRRKPRTGRPRPQVLRFAHKGKPRAPCARWSRCKSSHGVAGSAPNARVGALAPARPPLAGSHLEWTTHSEWRCVESLRALRPSPRRGAQPCAACACARTIATTTTTTK